MNDALKRALHTFWQTLLGSLGAVWVASGIDVSQIKDIDAAKKAGLALVTALVAAALSAAKTTAVGYLDQRKITAAVTAAAGPSPSGTPAAFVDAPVSFDPPSPAGSTGDHPAAAPAVVPPSNPA